MTRPTLRPPDDDWDPWDPDDDERDPDECWFCGEYFQHAPLCIHFPGLVR